MRTLVALPDKFRGTLAARAVCEAIAAGGRSSREPEWQVVAQEMSDGGEGFGAVLAPDGIAEVHRVRVTGPDGAPVVAEWRSLPGPGRRAVIEAASACGLQLAGGPERNDPVAATTRGVGELLVAARAGGSTEILLGCGGSATTDGGRGALEALGSFPPRGAGVLGDTVLVVAYDVSARFVDAARLFGPQKGAGPLEIETLTDRLAVLGRTYRDASSVDIAGLAGSGAAGGLAGGLAAIGGTLRPGIDVVSEAVDVAGLIGRADAVVTGEGGLDESSFSGKVVGRMLDACVAIRNAPHSLVVVGTATEAGRQALGAHRSGATLVALDERFGPVRAVTETAALVSHVVTEWLAGLA